MNIDIKKVLPVSLVAVLGLASCNDLDTEIYGQYASTEQKKEVTEKFPEKLMAGVSGSSAAANQWASVWTAQNWHADFGIPSLMLALDSRGTDMISITNGYNKYMSCGALTDATTTSATTNYAWFYPYQVINAANTLLITTGEESTDPETMFFIAQARGERANAYMLLAQIYQFTYIGHESDPCVPIVTSKNMEEIALAGGNPRASVADVYKQIMEDLDVSIDYLSRCGIKPSNVLSSKSKRLVSLSVAYGLRARAELLMGQWNEAAVDARAAMKGLQPASLAEVSAPSFWSIEQDCWMWGYAINETDDVVQTGICNWPSMMGSFNGNAYAAAGMSLRHIEVNLFNKIPAEDVRKGWWIDTEGKSTFWTYPADDAPDSEWKEWANKNPFAAAAMFDIAEPYTQIKFAPYQNVLWNAVNGQDILRMRVEEMIFIEAEAMARLGDVPGAKNKIQSFVNTYRWKDSSNPYVCQATSEQEMIDEIWFQRRIELWGEGISYLDLMRLKKGIDRRNSNWPEIWTFNVAPESNIMRIPIPNDEIQANAMISASQNNPSSPQPSLARD